MDKPTDPIREQVKQDASDVRKNYTRAANMLIYGYRNLSPQEKWLYFCLIHLCGPRGTRYLSLRFISEQTGISVGALSSSKDKNGKANEGMVRHLHDAGLIHSEIKKRDGRGNAQYHITITDVWALNQAFFIERNQTRSDFGQDENETSEPVRISDAPVQISDKPVQYSDKSVRNSDEPVRNPVQLQDYSKTTNKITDKTDKQEGTYSAGEQNSTAQNVANATTPARHSQSINFVEAREYLTALGYKLEPTPQAYECEEPGKALWSVSEPDALHLFETLTTTEIKRLAQRLKERAPDASEVVLIPGHDYSEPHLDANCAEWRAVNQGKTCQDYQAAINAARLAPARTITLAGMISAPASQISPTTTQGEQDGQHFTGITAGSNVRVSNGNPPAPGGDTQRTTDAQREAGQPQIPHGADHGTARKNTTAVTLASNTPPVAQQSEQDSVATPDLSTLTGGVTQDSAHVEPKAEQATLIERPAVPEIPSESAKWCSETLVQIVEAKNKKYYRETTRQRQIAAARRILRDDPTLTREQFVMAYDERNDDWWSDHKGLLHVNHMAEKDRVHEMLERIEVRATRKSNSPSSQSQQSNGKGYTLAVNDPNYNIDDDFYNNAAAWAAFDTPKGDTIHV